MDFNLQQLTDRYLQKYAPLVNSPRYKRKIPIYDYYEDVMELINRDSDLARAYKKKLLGSSVIAEAPPEYWDTSLFLSLEGAVSYQEWQSLPIHERARLRAMIHLRNMADLLERHEKEMEEEREKVMNGKKKN